MKPVTIIRHIACEGPGYLENSLKKYKIPIRMITVDAGDDIPAILDDSCGLIIMGGPMSVNDNNQWITQEINLIRDTIDNNLPVLGHCLGGQFIARALGAKINKSPVKEIGWLPVYAEQLNTATNWLSRFQQPQPVFHWHGESFDLPEGAERLLSSEHCKNQAFIYKDNVLAFQCHIEMTADMIDEWSTLYADEINTPSDTIQRKADMMQSTEQYINNLNQLADCVYQDWIQHLV